MTHSLLVSDGGLGGVSAVGEVAEVGVGEGLSDAVGRTDCGGAAGARRGGDVAAIVRAQCEYRINDLIVYLQ
jgi:hypothetical protein